MVKKAPADKQIEVLLTSIPASAKDVKRMLRLKPNASGNTRSEWRWIRLYNGDLILAIYPQGDTYIEISDRIGI